MAIVHRHFQREDPFMRYGTRPSWKRSRNEPCTYVNQLILVAFESQKRPCLAALRARMA
ncbi:hypothetical protein NOVOSPHI9U_420330 [Novosphingobium sp. 9U]|nr:hypothetical protein NOVOSPHI9U_420330 [Novosphingobium sp. 9U]